MPEELYGKKIEIRVAFGKDNGYGYTITGVLSACKAGYIILDDKKYINPKYVVSIEEI